MQDAIKIALEFFCLEGELHMKSFVFLAKFVAVVTAKSQRAKSCLLVATLKRLTAFSRNLIVRINRISW